MDNMILEEGKDMLFWKLNGDGEFFLSSIWQKLRRHPKVKSWAHIPWHVKTILRHNFIMWLLFLRRLCTRDKLAEWGIVESNECSFCAEAETTDHLFFKCDFSSCVVEAQVL
ncbi:hypothetical protein LIER_16897 [Lithospermum erythrorhizon]|uniref:Reverse transcriptase zinc-binding domain-containing protein n=1 Tax=Lithospermum erythrorhizon TaxID=34254 RepID=A0AAV3Q8N4_LITER